jgi:hypothetical protein
MSRRSTTTASGSLDSSKRGFYHGFAIIIIIIIIIITIGAAGLLGSGRTLALTPACMGNFPNREFPKGKIASISHTPAL